MIGSPPRRRRSDAAAKGRDRGNGGERGEAAHQRRHCSAGVAPRVARVRRIPAMPIVTIQQSPAPELDPKRRLVAGITQAFVDAYGVAPESVQVFIHEIDDEHWVKSGPARGRPANARGRADARAGAALARRRTSPPGTATTRPRSASLFAPDVSYAYAPLRRAARGRRRGRGLVARPQDEPGLMGGGLRPRAGRRQRRDHEGRDPLHQRQRLLEPLRARVRRRRPLHALRASGLRARSRSE